MAPGLNGCQSGSVPKNKAKTRNRAAAREFFDAGNSWEPPYRQNSFSFSESDSDLRSSRPAALPGSLVDNDNGELSWGQNQSPSEVVSAARAYCRRPSFWMSSNQQSASGSQNGAEGRNRSNAPTRQQVVTKLACIEDYIEQTESIMRELRSADTPACKAQHDSLAIYLADLKDSEKKLRGILRGMDQLDAKIDRLLNQPPQSAHINGDGPTEEELHRRTEEHNRKVDALEKQKQELLELQQLAQQKLADAEAERARLLNRATSINTDAIAGTSLEANLQSLTERLRNVERVCDDSSRLSASLDRSPAPADNQEDDQAEGELSDTETDYQLVRDKVAELNAMKAQLAQLQNMMATIEADHDGSETGSRRSQPRDLQKIERAVNQITDLNRLVASVRNLEIEDHEDESPQRDRDEVAVEAMQQMTRDFEEQTAKMKIERDSLIQARKDLQNIVRLANRRAGSSADDSETEPPPSLLPANLGSASRNLPDDELGSRSGGRKSNESAGVRVPPRGARPRTTWNQSLPILHNISQETLDRRRKDTRSSQSSGQNIETHPREPSSNWSHETLNADSLYQTQNQLEESAQLCEQMLQEAVGGRSQVGANPDLTGILYTHQQMLTKTVSHCCTLIWLQQRQINELRNSMILQQSTNGPNQQPSVLSQGAQFPCGYPSMFPRDFPIGSRIQKPHDPSAGGFYYQDDAAARPAIPQPNPSNQSFPPFPADLQYLNPRLNANQFSPRSGNPELMINNQIPPMPPVMACFSPEELGPSGALNNQVPPGNRANNYWDNFRSYSRQNLLSTTKSNENSDTLRRSGRRQGGNQERTPHAIVPPNNQSQNPVGEVQPLRHAAQTAAVASSSSPHISNHSDRPGSSDSQARVRNNTNGVRNRTRPQPWAPVRENQDGSYNRVRNDTGNSPRNRVDSNFTEMPADSTERPNNWSQSWNSNNRSDSNNIFTVLRLPTSVYQEVANFIHANEARPNFLIQLFRDLQQVTSDPQRQRALQSLQEVAGLNNAVQEPRNNILHETRSNLNRNWDEAAALDELFDHLRENQNTIRQNIVATAPPDTSGNNLENPNISNIREISGASSSTTTNPRNNFDHNRIRDLQSYFEGNFCNVGPGSSLKNPNLSNIRENLTEGVSPTTRDLRNPKNGRDLNSFMEGWRRTGHVRRYNVPYNVSGGMFFMDDGYSYDRMTAPEVPPFPPNDYFNNSTRNTFTAPHLHADVVRCVSPMSEWEEAFPIFPPTLPQPRMMFNPVNTDLAEADQSTDQMGHYMTEPALGVCLEVMLNDQKPIDEPLEEEVGHPLETDPNENMESNNNGSKSPAAVKNRRDASNENIVKKISKTRLEEAFSAAADGDWPENGASATAEEIATPMMDMAGALEHLIDYRPQETNSYGNQDSEWDPEGEAWLDQVPTRLESREAEGAEKDETK